MKTIPQKIIALALVSTSSLLAQTVSPPLPPPLATQPVEAEEIVLEPFVVNTQRDQGYLAVDALAGGRQNTPLRVTPSSVSSLTKQFINDLGITDLNDALKWSLNVVPTNFRSGAQGGNAGDTFNFWSVSIRGDSHVQGGNPPTKNYFPTFMMIDTYNVDRVEVNSGPNSILFGIGDIGGSLTTYTKTPRFDKTVSDVSAQTSNYGGYRFAGDFNYKLNDQFALRLNAVYANEKGWRDGDFDRRKGAVLAMTYKFSDRGQLRLEVEAWRQERNIYAGTVQDGVALWNGTTSAATWGAPIAGIDSNPVNTPGAPGVKSMNAWGGPANYQVYIAGLGLMNWAGGARSMGTGDVATGAYLRPDSFVDGQTGATIPALPSREFAVSPRDSVLKPEALTATLSYDQRVNEHSEFQLQGYRYVDSAKATNFEGAGGGNGYGVAVDLNKQLPNGQPNPNFGKMFSDFFLDKQTQDHRVFEVRGQYTYHFETTLWNIPLNQSFSISAGHQQTDFNARQYQAQYLPSYDPNNWQQSMVWGRVYWDNPQQSLGIPAGGDIAYLPLPFNWFDFNSTQKINYAGVFSQTRLWDDRLNITLGGRRDDYKNNKIGIRGTGNTNVEAKDAGNTFTIGAVGYVLPWLGVVGNISSNFQPAAGGLAPTVYGKSVGPSFGKGRDLGLRVSTKDHKYYASANYYRSKSTDVIGGDSPGFQGIWDNYFKAGGTATDIGPAGIISGTPGNLKSTMNYVDTYDVKYHGIEFEVVANPTKNIRLQARYSRPKGEKTNDGPNGRQYLLDHLAEWQQVATGNSPEATTLAASLKTAQDMIVTTSVPTITALLPKMMFNVFGTYSFIDGSLAGLDIGAGATMMGKQYGQPWESVNGVRTLAPGYTTYSGLVSYSTKFVSFDRQVHAKFQINVDNIFNEDKLIYTGYQTYGTNQIQPGNYRFLNPRKFTFSVNFTF